MLKIKLFRGFAILVVIFSVVSATVGIRLFRRNVMEEAQTRVRLDLNSAWSVFDGRLREIETVMRLVAGKEIVVDCTAEQRWDDPELRQRLERIRANFGLDFLAVTSTDGAVGLRAAPPYNAGDLRISSAAVRGALAGEVTSGVDLMSPANLMRESDGLAERAYFELEDTPRARRTQRRDEARGMVMISAVPVVQGAQVVGSVYGGILLNRNHDLIDRIHEVVYKNEMYGDRPMGTATLFLQDSRIATTVRLANGNRALGTRVSKEVADQVLDNGTPWVGGAFVVRDWYLTAYDPIRDGTGRVIGMLYVGILRKPFDDQCRGIVFRYVALSLLAMALALALAFLIAGRLAAPIHRLVEAANRTARGKRGDCVATDGACHETEMLIHAFNEMTRTLADREDRLKTLNRSYMETLGFVSHELKSPLSSIMNYLFLMRTRKLGEITPGQERALGVIDQNSRRIVEMVRHYLNLSRIENGELQPVRTRLAVRDEILAPLLDAVQAEVQAHGVTVENNVGPETAIEADINMVREIFENLVGNGLKYGRDGGLLRLDATPRDGLVEFCVRNEGAGIPEERLPELFQKFSRLDGAAAARTRKGSGLGLFITKHLVEAHGGTITARSEAGRWAEFVFTLPRAATAQEDAGRA